MTPSNALLPQRPAPADGTEALLSAGDLRVTSGHGDGATVLVSGIDLRVRPGETVGIVGESGSGKSLTARTLIGLPPPGISTSGTLTYAGRDLRALPEKEWLALRGREIGLVMQDPFTSLNPLRTCGHHIDELLRDAEGRRPMKATRRAEVTRRLAEVGITDPDVADRYPFELSGGMRQRVAIAAALARNPRLLIADEPTTALDTVVQDEILRLLADVQAARGMGLLLITHDLRIAFSVCDRVYVMYAGQVLETGPSAALSARPAHPYTRGLLCADPPIDRVVGDLVGIAGSVPAAAEVVDSCAFTSRCGWAAPGCSASRPALLPLDPGDRASACRRLPEIGAELVMPDRAAPAPQAPRVTKPDTVLRITGLRKSFRRGRRSMDALRGVDLNVDAGESVGLVGASGSGKTTLARCVVGLESPGAGRIEVGGIDATDFDRVPAADRSRLRGTVQYVFQDPYSSLNPAMTIGATLSEALDVLARRTGERVDRPEDLLERVGLPAAYTKYKPAILSGGERQRVAIARAIAVRPALIVCDEPVSALDVSVQAHVLTLLRELRAETGVGYLFITHDLAVVRQMVDRVYVLNRGEVVEHGPMAAVLDHPAHEYTRRLRAAVPGETHEGDA